MTKIIAILNQKGGVGKTTTAVNLAAALSAIGKRALVVDLDPQSNASSSLGIEEKSPSIYDVLIGDTNISGVVRKTLVPGLDIITSDINLIGADLNLASKARREYVLRDKLSRILNEYDYVIFDCPPTLGLLSVNALVAATDIIIPMQCEFLSLEGLSHLLETVKIVQRDFNPDLKILGVLLTMYDRRNRLTEVVEEDVRSCLKELVFDNVIPRNIKLSEAPSHGKPAIIYDYRCSGSVGYINLVSELLERLEQGMAGG